MCANEIPFSSEPGFVSRWLSRCHPALFSAYCITAAFGTYFCMYAYRKPFTAATYANEEWLGISFKTILVASQVGGYTLSKFIGIKVVSEMPARYRAPSILGLICFAEFALLLFAMTPVPWNFMWLFANGLPLGMVFGLVLGFLEGRKVTEALSAGLCASFILSSGFVKSVGVWLTQRMCVPVYLMPFATGYLFIVPLLVCVWLLAQIPAPSSEDEIRRTVRMPMGTQQRRSFFKRHTFGLLGLLSIYLLLTIVRSLRDDFGVEIWRDLGVNGQPTVFARSEFWVMLGVIAANGLAIVIRDNRFAFLSALALVGSGFVVVIGALTSQFFGMLDPMSFMVLLGLGLYVPYVAFHTTVFERMLAAFRETGTVCYLMYLADAFGYLAYIVIMVFRNIATQEEGFLNLLVWTSGTMALFSIAVTAGMGLHYWRTLPRDPLSVRNS